MNFGIIAAGDGSRLAAEGIRVPKPLLPIGGVPLLERLIGLAAQNGATTVACIVNEGATEVRRFLEEHRLAVPVQVVVKTTPSSLHSLHALLPLIGGGPFCLFTVDAVCRGAELSDFLAFAARQDDCDAVMATTDFINDEKPLYVREDAAGRILSFDDTASLEAGPRMVTGGIYYFFPAAVPVIDEAVREGTTHLRNALRRLLDRGLKVVAFPFSRIVDVDDRSDIAAAEELVAQETASSLPRRTAGEA
jgi:NDP-sugar pyrophosphorylase family protein